MKPLLVHHRQLSSTNDFALQWLKIAGLGETMVVTTDHQMTGRGQRQREWDQQAGLDLAWTLAHKRDSISPTNWAITAPFAFNKSVAVRVCQVIEPLLPSHVEIGIKWPNDIMLRAGFIAPAWQKCAGLLIENTWRGSQWEGVAVGVGMNVFSNRLSQSGRISLADVCDSIPALSEVSELLTQRIASCLSASPTMAFDDSAYQQRLLGRQSWETYTYKGVHGKGFIQGVDDLGRLCVDWQPRVAEGHSDNSIMDTLTVQDSKELTWDWLNG